MNSRLLHHIWASWKVAAHKIGDFQARLLLNIFYFLILSPFALGVKMFSDPLQIRSQNVPQWLPREKKPLASARDPKRQF
jgi:hypothetical protein